jgi:hypothetical protein
MERDYSHNTHHEPKPSNDLSWAIATNSGMTSPIHIDAAGLCTAIFILTGAKYWCIATPMEQTQDPKSVHAFDDFDPMEAESSLRWEGVLLSDRTVL